jgi:hypothetical protein
MPVVEAVIMVIVVMMVRVLDDVHSDITDGVETIMILVIIIVMLMTIGHENYRQ